jgi:hypothetical protein
MAVFWVVAGLLPHHQGPDDGGSKDLWNVGKFLPDYNPEDSHLRTHRRENLKT